MKKGTLYLIPSLLGECDSEPVISLGVKKIISSLEFFIVENEKSARYFLKNVNPDIFQQNLKIFVLDKHNDQPDYSSFLKPAREGKNTGLLSEAGCPAVADPGAAVVELAHKLKIKVVPLVGPSAILLALMASGLNGQQFCFHGYLPVEKEQRKAKIKQLEKESQQKKQTQIFIETPYRNMQMVQELMNTCEPGTLLCIATDITLPSEMIMTCNISEWKKSIPEINRRPSVFLLLKK